MPRFYFHLASPDDYSRDDTGIEFANFYDAYVDAYRAAAEMSVDLVYRRADLNRYSFVIADDEGHILADLPFVEPLRAKARSQRQLHMQIAGRLDRCRELRSDCEHEVNKARSALAQTRALLQRSPAPPFPM